MENLTAFVRERTRRTEAERTAKPLQERLQEHAYLLWETAGRPDRRGEAFWSAALLREKLGDPPSTDIAAVLTVIKRRSEDDRAQEARDQRALDLRESVLRQADLAAHLEDADLYEAHVEGADLSWAQLVGARLLGAHLEGADLYRAHLEGAFLYEAHLEGAFLSGALGLTQRQIDTAFGDAETRLPAGLTRPAHWLEPKGGSAPAA
jgi:hypothetical protein